MMKSLQKRFVFAYLALSLTAVTLAGSDAPDVAGVKVIANPSIAASTVSAAELKSVFLAMKTSLGNGSRVEPVLENGGAAHEAFVKHYLQKTDAALQIYYRSLVFTGKASMPKMLGSDAQVVAYVARTRGAIGYVSAATSTAGVKTLEVR